MNTEMLLADDKPLAAKKNTKVDQPTSIIIKPKKIAVPHSIATKKPDIVKMSKKKKLSKKPLKAKINAPLERAILENRLLNNPFGKFTITGMPHFEKPSAPLLSLPAPV